MTTVGGLFCKRPQPNSKLFPYMKNDDKIQAALKQ